MSSAPAPRQAPSPLDMFGSRRGVIDTALAPTVFVVVNSITGLHVAAAAAVAVALVLMVERLARRASAMNAVGGLIGTGIAVYIALRTGSAAGYFVPKAIQNAVYGLGFAISITVRRPLIGVFVQLFYRQPQAWARDPRVRPAFTVATWLWVVLFGVRAVVYTTLIALGKVEWLGAVVLVLGFPAFALTLFGSYRYVTWRLGRPGVPGPEAFREPVPAGA